MRCRIHREVAASSADITIHCGNWLHDLRQVRRRLFVRADLPASKHAHGHTTTLRWGVMLFRSIVFPPGHGKFEFTEHVPGLPAVLP